MKRDIEPNSEAALEPLAGAYAIRALSVKLDFHDDPQVTRSMILRIGFDGDELLWCPVGDFFGSGVGLHPFQDWYRTVSKDGTLACR